MKPAARRTGCTRSTRSSGCATHRPEVFQAARRYVSAKEYVAYRLTGAWRVDYSLAAGSGFLDTDTLQWSGRALELAGIRADQLSPLAAPSARLGTLQPEVAGRMGVPAGTPVAMGSSDAVNSSIGAGAVTAAQATLMIGTSGALRVVSPRPVLDPAARSWCYAIDERHWLIGGAINNGGVALSWLRDCLNQARAGQALSFEDVLALAGRAPAGSGGLVCLPFFAGERSPNWNLNARAAFFGMSLEHGLPHMARALLEGIGFRFKSLLEVLVDIGLDVEQIVASGGFTQSDAVAADDGRCPGAGAERAVLGRDLGAGGGLLGGALRRVRRRHGGHPVVGSARPCLSTGPDGPPLFTSGSIRFTRKLYQAAAGSFDDIVRLQNDLAETRDARGRTDGTR